MPPAGSKYIKYTTVAGLSSIPIIAIFWYLFAVGAIDITGYSHTENCAGMEGDYCYLYMNFTAYKNIYIQKDSQWVNTTPPVKSIKLQRSWGSSWRTIDLNKTWSKRVKYAVKFSTGRSYQIRFVAEKYHPRDVINWSINPVGIWDVPLATETCDTKVIYEKVNSIDKYINITICPKANKTHPIPNCYNQTYFNGSIDIFDNVSKCIKGTEKIEYINSTLYTGDLNIDCTITNTSIICDDSIGGDGNGDGICQSGETCYSYDLTDKIELSSVKNGDVKIK